jgi:hypothetical protein
MSTLKMRIGDYWLRIWTVARSWEYGDMRFLKFRIFVD